MSDSDEPPPRPQDVMANPKDLAVIQTALQLAKDIQVVISLLTDGVPNDEQAAEIAESLAVTIARAHKLVARVRSRCLPCGPL